MKRAIQLAKKGEFSVAPNPMVGAVVVHDEKVIGEGYHQKYGEAHAEVNAINAVKDPSLLKESTIYVTLEPCSHFGKTPPCADLIVSNQLKRVVIANLDPSEKVAGKGVERIKNAGIDVTIGVCAEEGNSLNHRFFSLYQKKRPYVILKWASTADGFLGRDPEDLNATDSWITSALSKQRVHLWRAQEMGILVGKNTALIDDPELNVREVSGRNPVRFLIDPNLEVPKSAKIFNDQAPTVVLNLTLSAKESNHSYVQFKEGELIKTLFAYCVEEGIHSLIVEGGIPNFNTLFGSRELGRDSSFYGKQTLWKGHSLTSA